MKKILHLFSDPSHSALWSRYLRMLTLIALFAFGSHGVWGEETGTPKKSWTPEDKKLTGDVFTGDNMSINLVGTWQYVNELSAIKKGASATYPDKKDDVSGSELNTYLSGKSYIKIAAKATGTIKVKGLYGDSSYKIVVGRTEWNGSVKFFEDPIQSFQFGTSTEFEFMVFENRDYYVFVPEGGDAIFQGIEFFAAHGNNVTLAKVENGEVTLEVAYPYITNTIITEGNTAQCVDGYDITIKPQPAPGYLYWRTIVKATDNTEAGFYSSKVITKSLLQEKKLFEKDITFTPEFVKGIKVSALAEVGGTAKYSLDNIDQENGSLYLPDKSFVFTATPYKGYTFSGWYNSSTLVSSENPYTTSTITADLTLTAKFECNIANNTQKVDLSKYYEPGGNVDNTATKWDDKNKTLSVTTKGQWDNVLYLTKINNENRGTGIRIHASGKPYRVIVRFNEKVENETKSLTKDIKIDESTEENDYHTHHYSWKKFGLTDAQISQITDVGVAGLNTTTDETKYTFYVKHFWIDDIADYDHTIACYGEEKGEYNWGSNVYTYSHTNDGVKAAFSNISGDDRNNDTYSIKFKTGDTNKLNISSSNYNFSSIGLVFDSSVSYNLSIGSKTVSGNGVAVVVPVNGSSIDIINNGTEALSLAKITYTGEAKGINEKRTITVDGIERTYWIYAPGKVNGKTNVPVIFSLHGRQENGADPDKTDAPKFNSIADSEDVIIVYPQGRNGNDQGYPNRTENGKEVAWNSGYAGNNYGWEATGQENADTKFIQALVDELKKNKFYNNTTVDPKRFYLCGFSMGGMMTYACAKVLNGTFAAYGSCGGFPLNEFHLNLATKQPVPFMHLHGDADNVVEIKHLHTIIENLLFRNGCSLKGFAKTDEWESDTYNGNSYEYKRYDFTGVNDVPVTTVTFKGLWHGVHPSAPKYLWDFFSYTSDTYKPTTTTMKWQWDMTTINSNLSESNGYPYGWKRVTNANPTYLTYGDNRNTGNTGNHNVYNSIQLEKGTYKLHAKANVLQSDNTGITVGIYKVGAEENSGTCIIRRKVVNNSGAASNNFSILYPFVITEDGEYYVKVERGNSQNTCTALAIHTSDYAPDDEDDSENVTTLDKDWQTDGLIVKIDFEDVKKQDGTTKKIIDLIKEESGAILKGGAKDKNGAYSYVLFTGEAPKYPDSSASDDSPKYDVYNLYCRHDGDIDKNTWGISDVIHNDAIFGNYFQNIPKAQFFDRSAGQNYMRAVLPKNALSPIKKSGAATIGFWVNGRVAVDAGLSYNDASMLYLSGAYHSNQYGTTGGTGKYEKEYQSMFNIRCNGNTNGFLKFFDEKSDSTQMRYYANTMFGDLCDNDINNIGKYYKKNLYLDRNWHYITMVMYNDLRNVDMYVDGELTQSRQNIVGSDQDLKAGLDSINHIIIGGLNATYTNFTYDPAFAFDDIVIYSRALSAQEIQEIIKEKNYSPNSWDFEKNIANTALLNKDKLKEPYWIKEGNDVYTLNKKLDTPAELTYDGNRVIPAFRGLKFETTVEKQIKIDMTKKSLIVANGIVNMTISNAPAGQYLRYEYDNRYSGWLDAWNYQDFKGDIWPSDTTKIGITEVSGETGRQICKCNVHGAIYFKSIGSTDKIYTDLCFGSIKDSTVYEKKRQVFKPTPKVTVNTKDFSFTEPELHLIFNGLDGDPAYNKYNSQVLANYKGKIKFWSSAPHVAYIKSIKGDNQPEVKVTGVPGSAYIYAELENNNQYDCNTADKDLYASSNRILARYEIHVPNSEPEYSVKISADTNHDKDEFIVGEVLKTTDEAVTLTLGGWNYNSNKYFGNIDGYTKKETWKGMPLNKTTNDTNGYQSVYDVSDKSGNYTDDNTYSGLNYYTGGTHAAKSEQLDGADNKGLFYTESVKNNSTAWTLPCRGSYAKVEPTEAGIISVYVLQEGCMERNMTGKDSTYFDSYEIAKYEPYDINIKKVYVADEAGKIIDEVITDTKSKIVSQVWKDDERARAEYSFYVSSTAYSLLLHNQFLNNIVKLGGEDDAVLLLNKWTNPGMTQNIIKFGKGYGIVDKGIVRYTFNVLPGKTYYIFSNDAKMGIAGFNFTKDKQLNFEYYNTINDNKINDYSNITSTPTVNIDTQTPVSLNDGENYTAHTEKNAEVTLNRTFYKNYWNAICLPYSINRRQIEDQFGDGTMVVLMNNINTSTKKVMFIEHANQDIIAGYPYLIFPTTKEDKDKTDHSEINGIKTRATFGEADSPLFSVGTDGITYTSSDMQKNALVFKGTFSKEDLPVGSYVITKLGTLANVPQTGLKINPYRAYIHFNKTDSGAKAIKLASMGFAGFDDMEGETTSIEDLLFNDGIMTRPADVFTVNGQKVRSKAENLYGLPKGVYIVNGKKYVNK